jgi:hypothetical protein
MRPLTFFFIAAVAVLGCASANYDVADRTTSGAGGAALGFTSLTINPSTVILDLGSSQAFTATAIADDGESKDVTTLHVP